MPEEQTHEKSKKLKSDEYERDRTRSTLQHRLDFEQLIAKISSEFAGIGGDSIDPAIDRALSSIGTFTGADRAYIFQFKNGGTRAENTHEWCAESVEPQIEKLKDIRIDEELPWFTKHIRKREVFHVPDVAALPPEALLERHHFEDQQIQSLIVVPMETAESLIGFLGFDAVRERRIWSDDDKALLQFFSQILGNVIERKRVEEALQKSEERYRLLANNISDNIWMFDLGTMSFTYVSPSVIGVLGYTAEEATGLHLQDILPPSSLELATNILNEELSEASRNPDPSRSRTLEIEQYHKDGTTVWTEASMRFIYDRKGQPISILGVTRNIAERKEYEEALRKSEEKYRSFLQNFQGIAYKTALTAWTPIFFHGAVEELTGFSKDEFINGTPRWDQVIHPKDKKDLPGKEEVRSIPHYSVECDYRIIRKDGNVRWVHEFSRNICDRSGKPVELEGIIIDITARKQTEEKLLKSEEKYRNILESIEDGYYEVDIAGNFVFFNDSMCKILHYSKNELIGMNNRQYMDKENAKKVFDAFNLVYRTGEPYKAFDWELIRKDGSRCCVETSVSLIKDADGQPMGFQGITRDVTERKKMEKEKVKLEYLFRQAEKMEAIGILAGGVAHDLNNILSGIVGYPDLLLLQLSKDSPLRKPILTIQESGNKAAAIVRDLLTLARRGVANYEVLNLNDIIYEYLKSPEYEKLNSLYPDIELDTNLEAGLLNILGSPIHILNIVMNLVSNAAEAVVEDKKISISTKNRYIDRPISGYENIEEGDYVVLTVSDSGTGINSEDMKRIFEPFYSKKKMGRSGTGLGMTVVWGTVKDHKGYIDLQSTEGKGTTFRLYFPVTRQELAKDQVELPIEDYMGRGQSILVVDDMKEQRELVSAMLSKLGYSTEAVSSGEEAVKYLQNHSVDLLILDMIMDPGMDGLEVYQQIIKRHPGQKVIIASGYAETSRVKEAQRLGVGQYIRKPYTLEKIGIAVKSELEKKIK
jgi:two-component system, cell cycle sensor histidine kinase and response regulator CckA